MKLHEKGDAFATPYTASAVKVPIALAIVEDIAVTTTTKRAWPSLSQAKVVVG
jgi:hypothetical protein